MPYVTLTPKGALKKEHNHKQPQTAKKKLPPQHRPRGNRSPSAVSAPYDIHYPLFAGFRNAAQIMCTGKMHGNPPFSRTIFLHDSCQHVVSSGLAASSCVEYTNINSALYAPICNFIYTHNVYVHLESG